MAREVLSNGVIVPEKYTRDWFDDFRTNLVKLNDAITAIAGKQNALTQEQLDAVNSAITSQKVTAYDDHIADTSKHLTDGTASKAIADEDGTSIKTGYVNVAGNQTVTGDKSFTGSNAFNNILPNATNTYSLGSSSYQWSSVYAQSYYYNGTAWGLDKVNEWSAQQKITGNNTRGVLSIWNPVHTKGSATSTSELSIGTIFLGDGGATGLANSLGFVSCDLSASGNKTTLSLSAIKNEASSTERANLVLLYDKSDNTNPEKILCKGAVIPNSDSTYPLGTSTNKWKTLNGINPGALSLPSSSYVEIDTTNWDLTGATSQSYTPTVHGWLFISIQNISGNYLSIVGGRGAVSMDGTGAQAGLRAMLPAVANESVSITVKTGSIFAARFYPMLGNV